MVSFAPRQSEFEVENACSSTSPHPHVFLTGGFIKQRELCQILKNQEHVTSWATVSFPGNVTFLFCLALIIYIARLCSVERIAKIVTCGEVYRSAKKRPWAITAQD